MIANSVDFMKGNYWKEMDEGFMTKLSHTIYDVTFIIYPKKARLPVKNR